MKRIEPLNLDHDRKTFDCNIHSELNVFLQQKARQQADKGISCTFVLIDSEKPTQIIGYFSLNLVEVNSERLPKTLAKKYPRIVPGVKLGRLAVDKNYQRQGFGRILLVDAMYKTLEISKNAGVIGLFVDAKDKNAKDYYLQYGFCEFQDNSLQLFLPLGTVKKLLKSNGKF